MRVLWQELCVKMDEALEELDLIGPKDYTAFVSGESLRPVILVYDDLIEVAPE